MLYDARRHVDRVAGADLALLDSAALGLPLDRAAAAQDEIDLLEIGAYSTSTPSAVYFVCLCQWWGL